MNPNSIPSGSGEANDVRGGESRDCAVQEKAHGNHSRVYTEISEEIEAFEAWAALNMGRSYNLAREKGHYLDQVTRWAYHAFIAGCRHAREAERKACWDDINKHIKFGPLPGNGCDQQAERNGLIMATNILDNRGVRAATSRHKEQSPCEGALRFRGE